MIFVDTSAWLALLNKRDRLHNQAVECYREMLKKKKITTDAVLLETFNSLSNNKVRYLAVLFIEQIEKSVKTEVLEIVNTSGEVFRKGLDLFKQYNDKNWRLTDCISFSVMKEKNIKEAFTADRHFVQAGFEKLLS